MLAIIRRSSFTARADISLVKNSILLRRNITNSSDPFSYIKLRRNEPTMDYVELNFKKVKAYLPADATLGASSGGKGIRKTSAKDKISKAKARLEELISGVAESMHEKLSHLPGGSAPSSIELTFTVGFSAELDAWVMGGKAEQGIELKLVWERAAKEK